MVIYVVFGTTGEYSDRSEWLVKAFTDEDKAKELVSKASDFARELQNKRESIYDYSGEVNPYDSYYKSDYTGTSYHYAEVELE